LVFNEGCASEVPEMMTMESMMMKLCISDNGLNIYLKLNLMVELQGFILGSNAWTKFQSKDGVTQRSMLTNSRFHLTGSRLE